MLFSPACNLYSACEVYFDLLWRKTKTEEMARPERLELPTFWFVARRSIQLSYGRAVDNSNISLHLRCYCNLSLR